MLSDEAKQVIEQETSILTQVLEALTTQRKKSTIKLSLESEKARELTSAIVATRRDEDKQLLASDEAVAHTIRDKKEAELSQLEKLIKKPYFARFVVEEETDRGPKSFEYRIGFVENADCRIIDWRKAPIAKLYYEYREGDQYDEEILGKERVGTITLRNGVEIDNSQLRRISSRQGNFELKGNEWIAQTQPVRSRAQQTTTVGTGHSEESSTQGYHLPQIAALLTQEQFQLINESNETAMLIQGIAGSGKTTVALHRLAWLLGSGLTVSDGNGGQEPFSAERCAVIVLSKALRDYVSKTLPSLGVEGVRTLTLGDWLAETIVHALPHLTHEDLDDDTAIVTRVKRPNDRPASSVDRVRRSLALLSALESYVRSLSTIEKESLGAEEIIIRTLSNAQQIVELDETKLLDREIVKAAHARAIKNRNEKTADTCDDALLVRTIELISGGVRLRDGRTTKYQHLVADEVQDFSPIDLACVIGAVTDPRGVTLVGDTAQKIDAGTTFPGWDKLRRYWSFKDSMSKFISLNLSQRSTIPIVKLADYVQRRDTSKAIEGRTGRTPIWFKTKNEEQGLQTAIEWLTRAGEKYPGCLNAVLCRNNAEAKFAYRMLEPTFGAMLRSSDEYSFTFYEGIIVTSVEQVKGLEFTNVLIWNPTKQNYPGDEHHRNLLYTGITRAEENLSIVTWDKPTSLLPAFNSPLIRAHDLTIVEPEEQEQRDEDEPRYVDE